MQRYFSPTANDGRGAFFSEALHGARLIDVPRSARQIGAEEKAGKRARQEPNPACTIPEDAVAITAERHAELMAAQAQGKTLDQRGGKPVALDYVPSADELEAIRRRERDRRLSGSDWTQLPDALDTAQRASWAAYRQQLRDLDMAGTDWPPAPNSTPETDQE